MGFTFKQFHIEQEHTAMKVGTDGVLLGAWAKGGKKILDIGTGTGLIALMMAQRFPTAEIDAIEVDKEACIDAKENITKSPFSLKITLHNTSLQAFCKEERKEKKYDSIVCNPPYFINSLKNPSKSRTTARHTDKLSHTELMRSAAGLLSEEGTLSIIIPTENKEIMESEGYIYQLKVKKILYIYTTPRAPKPKRCMLVFTKEADCPKEEDSVILSNEDHSRSNWYSRLTKDFYIR